MGIPFQRADMVAAFVAICLLALIIIVATVWPKAEPEPQPVNLQQSYAEVYAWCETRFPGEVYQQRACQWGAYEMVPAEMEQP